MAGLCVIQMHKSGRRLPSAWVVNTTAVVYSSGARGASRILLADFLEKALDGLQPTAGTRVMLLPAGTDEILKLY